MAITNPLTAKWTGSLKGKGTIQSVYLNNSLAIPTVFGGTGEGNSPMDLLVASSAACYLLTTVGMLEAQQIESIELNLNTETDPESKTLIIRHFLEISLPTDVNEDQIKIVEDIINKADRACHVGNMLRKANVEIYAKGTVIRK